MLSNDEKADNNREAQSIGAKMSELLIRSPSRKAPFLYREDWENRTIV
jgi:hypothetical protein